MVIGWGVVVWFLPFIAISSYIILSLSKDDCEFIIACLLHFVPICLVLYYAFHRFHHFGGWTHKKKKKKKNWLRSRALEQVTKSQDMASMSRIIISAQCAPNAIVHTFSRYKLQVISHYFKSKLLSVLHVVGRKRGGNEGRLESE